MPKSVRFCTLCDALGSIDVQDCSKSSRKVLDRSSPSGSILGVVVQKRLKLMKNGSRAIELLTRCRGTNSTLADAMRTTLGHSFDFAMAKL